MPLIVTDYPYTLESVLYQANNLLTVPTDVWSYQSTLSPAPGRTIVGTPAAWVAGSYVANSAVSYNGVWYVNSSSATSGDVPGSSVKWVAVNYPAIGTSGGGVTTVGAAGFLYDQNGVNKYRAYAVLNEANILVPAVDQTPTP